MLGVLTAQELGWFSARDVASIVWLGGFVLAIGVWAAWHSEARQSLGSLARIIFGSELGLLFGSIFVVAAGLVIVGWRLGVWRADLTFDTCVWFGTALVLTSRAVSDAVGREFLARAFRKVASGALIVEVWLNLYSFPLLLEIVLVPAFLVLGLTMAFSEGRAEYEPALKVLRWIALLATVILLSYGLWRLIEGWAGVDWPGVGRVLILPVWLTAAIIPALWLVGAYATADSVLSRTRTTRRGRLSATRVLVAAFTARGVSASDLRSLPPISGWANKIGEARTLRETREGFSEWADARRDRARAEFEQKQRLEEYAGVDGEDDSGRRLDRREFSETQDALSALASAQMGWYRHQGERYRSEVLDPFQMDLDKLGLPEGDLIEISVAPDGQSWWAWRKTVTGWCLGIGAAAPPPDQWMFEAPEPPASGPPGEGWSLFGVDSKNW